MSGLLHSLKVAVTDMRYFARSKFSRILVHKRNFSLICQVVFKFGNVFCQKEWDTCLEFKWIRIKVASGNNSRYIYKQTIIKLSLAYSFRKTFFIVQNFKYVHITCSFLELLIFFWLTLADIYCLEFISHHIKEIFYVNKDSKGNQSWKKKFHLFLTLILKNPVF